MVKSPAALPAELENLDQGHGKLPGTDPRNRLNDLSSNEWVRETVSVWTQKGLGLNHPHAQIERLHPAPFSFTDISRLVRFFTKKGAMVLDPFVGVGSSLKACALEERSGLGIELNHWYVDLARQRLALEIPADIRSLTSQTIIQGDARDVLKGLPDNMADFVVTSPPYSNILHKQDHKAKQERVSLGLDTDYGVDPRDLGNIEEYQDFLKEVATILGECGRVLKPRKYMAVIVSDFRHKSKYVMYHADLANELEASCLELRGITVLFQPQKRVFPYGYPYAYVPNVHHQYILLLQNMK